MRPDGVSDISGAVKVPAAVKVASAFLIAVVLWILCLMFIQSGRLVSPLLVPTAAMALVSVGLLRRRRWAWWSALVLGCLWLTGGLISLTGVVSGDISSDLRRFLMLAAGVPVILLASAISLLLRTDSRALFR